MTALRLEDAGLTTVLRRLLGLTNSSGGLECDTEVDILAVRDTALDSAGVICSGSERGGVGRVGDESVVVDGARDLGASEAGADFEALGGGDGEHGMREHRLELVEAGLTETDGDVADYAGYGATDAVFFVAVAGDQVRHFVVASGVGAAHREEGVDFLAGNGREEGVVGGGVGGL